ncbi:PREDICTED: cyclin-dependent protein kinase inhibitor SMR3 [Prunus mume]|uniref:Cyclin-dependent protein kinase inhibitor SMR3 n=1 Tax=Prunus mume TaxID=102107 RepID=A0ABM0NZ82_PRUMU|nr:PREDICTED: cyclin-dependent protein kinase inhibitor SMR3 [Prunus mume]
MATGLDFCQDLPNPRFLTIKISTPKAQQPLSLHDHDALDEVAHGCRTPTSKEHKIPTVVTCPPAPRKPARRAASSCKRKLQFFETANQDEVEDFFRSSFLSNSRAKRSCPCT